MNVSNALLSIMPVPVKKWVAHNALNELMPRLIELESHLEKLKISEGSPAERLFRFFGLMNSDLLNHVRDVIGRFKAISSDTDELSSELKDLLILREHLEQVLATEMYDVVRSHDDPMIFVWNHLFAVQSVIDNLARRMEDPQAA